MEERTSEMFNILSEKIDTRIESIEKLMDQKLDNIKENLIELKDSVDKHLRWHENLEMETMRMNQKKDFEKWKIPITIIVSGIVIPVVMFILMKLLGKG
jgi:FtsZ-binding cell division protein ZapB